MWPAQKERPLRPDREDHQNLGRDLLDEPARLKQRLASAKQIQQNIECKKIEHGADWPKYQHEPFELSQTSIERAARLGYPLVMPMLGNTIDHYGALANYYRSLWKEHRHREESRIAVFAHLHVTETARETQQDFYPYYSAYPKPMFRGAMPPAVFARRCFRQPEH